MAGIVNLSGYLFLIAVVKHGDGKADKVENCDENIFLINKVKLICFDPKIKSVEDLQPIEQRYGKGLSDFME